MKKCLTLQELTASSWGERFHDVFRENLVCGFLHGNCLYEGFDALHESWQVSFVLRNTDIGEISALRTLKRKMDADNLKVGFFLSEKFLAEGQMDYPLEFLHISKRNAPLFGEPPLAEFVPNEAALRAECKRELKNRRLHLLREWTRIQSGISPMDFFIELDSEVLPILYGIYFLEKNAFPENREELLRSFPDFRVEEPALDFKRYEERAAASLLAMEKLADSL